MAERETVEINPTMPAPPELVNGGALGTADRFLRGRVERIVIYQANPPAAPATAQSLIRLRRPSTLPNTPQAGSIPAFNKLFGFAPLPGAVVLELEQDFPYGFEIQKTLGAGWTVFNAYVIYTLLESQPLELTANEQWD